MARTAATRLLAELAGRPALHALLVTSGAAEALASQASQLVRAAAGFALMVLQRGAWEYVFGAQGALCRGDKLRACEYVVRAKLTSFLPWVGLSRQAHE